MLAKAGVLGFASLMIVGATCQDQRSEPEAIAHCIDPRRIDFDSGFRSACEAAQRISHPMDAIGNAFDARMSGRSSGASFATVSFATVSFD